MKRRRGFSLLELVCACAIVAAMLAVTMLTSGRTLRTSGRQSAAALVETELRAARERALGEQKLVAVVMRPGAGGEIGLETGAGTPRRDRVTSLSQEFRGATVTTGALAAPVPSDPRVPPAWFDPARAAVIFTPTGRMLSNLALDASGKVVLQCGQTRLTVDPGGTVTSELGGSESGAAAGTPLTRGVSTNHPPLVEAFELNTSATVKKIDGVQHADIKAGDLLNFEVTASDPDGDEQLFCLWTGGGSYSQPVRTPMLFDPATGKWKATATWQAPTPLAGLMSLRAEVTDRNGEPAVDESGGLATNNDDFKITVGDAVAERLVLPMDLIDKYTSICSMNPDGSGLKALWRGTPAETSGDKKAYETAPNLSPDGHQVAYVCYKSWPVDIVARNLDGSNRRVLCHGWEQPGFGYQYMFWNASGDSLYYSRGKPGNTSTGQLVKVQADGSDAASPQVIVNNRKCDCLFVSPDATKMVWAVYLAGNGYMGPASLEYVDLETGTTTLVMTETPSLKLGSRDKCVAWRPDNSGFVYVCRESTTYRLKQVNVADPTVSTNFTDLRDDADQVMIAPNGNLAYTTDAGRNVFLHGNLAAPADQGAAIIVNPSNNQYIGGPPRVLWGHTGRYLYYMPGPGSSAKIVRYDTQDHALRDLTRGLRTDDAATGFGGATDLQLLLEL